MVKGKSKSIPDRTCIACRTVRPKKELLRLVKVGDGIIEVDGSGKKNGRGAYVCRKHNCWQAAVSGNQLERSLRTRLNQEARSKLLEYERELVLVEED